jgi:hypothetical protein
VPCISVNANGIEVGRLHLSDGWTQCVRVSNGTLEGDGEGQRDGMMNGAYRFGAEIGLLEGLMTVSPDVTDDSVMMALPNLVRRVGREWGWKHCLVLRHKLNGSFLNTLTMA